MGARSRKRKRSGAAARRAERRPRPHPRPQPPADAMRRGYARGRARDDEIRANLEPLAPGERPRPS